jgi:hypothetical protein
MRAAERFEASLGVCPSKQLGKQPRNDNLTITTRKTFSHPPNSQVSLILASSTLNYRRSLSSNQKSCSQPSKVTDFHLQTLLHASKKSAPGHSPFKSSFTRYLHICKRCKRIFHTKPTHTLHTVGSPPSH